MRVSSLRIDDEFTYYGVKYTVFSINPPNISIQRVDGDKKVREVDYLELITNPSFSPNLSMKKEIDSERKKHDPYHRAFLDTLPDDKREKVSERFEMIKPLLVFEKARNGDFLSSITFNDIYKEYLLEGEMITDLSKEQLFQRISNKVGKSTRQLKRYVAAYYKEENELPNHGIDGLINKSLVHKNPRSDEHIIEICHPKKKEMVLDTLQIRMDKPYISIIKDAIEKYYLSRKKISIKYLYDIISIMCYNQGLKPIEYDTVYHIVKKRLDPRIKEIMRYGTDV